MARYWRGNEGDLADKIEKTVASSESMTYMISRKSRATTASSMPFAIRSPHAGTVDAAVTNCQRPGLR